MSGVHAMFRTALLVIKQSPMVGGTVGNTVDLILV
jgi:hypothetical protein